MSTGTAIDRDDSQAPCIAVVGPPRLGWLLDPMAVELAQLGCKVVRDRMTQAGTGANWSDTDVLVIAGAACDRGAMEAAPALRAIVTPLLGVDGVDEQAATDLGIVVANGRVPEAAEAIAESTIMLMLACLYDLPSAERAFRENRSWEQTGVLRGRMLKGKTIGIVGYGHIARAVVDRLQGWGSLIQVFSRNSAGSTPDPRVAHVSLDTLLPTSDIILVLASLNDSSHHLLNAERLALTKPGTILVNIARGGLVDEQALCALARSGHLKMIALDVFAVEPLPVDSPLRALPNAILTPHNVGHTPEATRAAHRLTIENVKRVLACETPASRRNPEVLDKWFARWRAP